jgi:hypothetical protein
MNALASLATTALLGTERRPPDWPAPDGPLGTTLARIPRDSVEKALLQTVGVLGTCQLAGLLPVKSEHSISAAIDDTKEADSRVDLLANILTDGPDRLIAEAFRKISALPHRLLPKALECGCRSTALRSFLLPVLGHRGLWLAAQNDAWKFAAGVMSDEAGSDDVWSHGSLDQRVSHLTALRGRDPAKARELITAAMSAEGAKERTAFIGAFATGLSLADQDLLESALTDKSKEARQAAARLLCTLPGSRFAQRVSAHLSPFLKSEKKLLRGTVFTIEAPTAYDAAWKADLIEEAKPKGHSLGERAWWLFQIVRQTPLSWWKAQTDQTPAELLAWAQKSDWKDALLLGWTEAQAVQRNIEWAEAFLDLPSHSLNVFDLFETLPPAQRETHFLRLITNSDMKTSSLSTLMDRFMRILPLDAPMLSPVTASKLAMLVKHRIHSGEARYDWQLRASLVELACLLPQSAFDDLAEGWELNKEEALPFAEAIARIGIVLDQRKQLLS